MFSIRRFLFGSPLEERPDVQCGDKKEHYEWIDVRMSCPNCMFKKIAKDKMDQAIKNEQKRKQDEEALAELIATKVVEKLRVPTAGSVYTKVPTAHCDISPMADGNA